MKNFLIYVLLTVFICSCGALSERISKPVTDAFVSPVVTSIATLKALTEATIAIYQKDSLKFNTPVFIRQLKVRFMANQKYVDLKLDSIQTILVNDSLIDFKKVRIIGKNTFYEDIRWPYSMLYPVEDTCQLHATCEYLPNMNFRNNQAAFKCITASYTMQEQKSISPNRFKECAKTE